MAFWILCSRIKSEIGRQNGELIAIWVLKCATCYGCDLRHMLLSLHHYLLAAQDGMSYHVQKEPIPQELWFVSRHSLH